MLHLVDVVVTVYCCAAVVVVCSLQTASVFENHSENAGIQRWMRVRSRLLYTVPHLFFLRIQEETAVFVQDSDACRSAFRHKAKTENISV